MLNPTIIEERQLNATAIDVFSRLMMDRIIFIGDEITPDLANTVIAQLLYLDLQADKITEPEKKEITIYINSPGGYIDDGLAIYDTMKFVKSPIRTVAVGMAASMASILLVAGDKRVALPHSRVLIHQPLGGMSGQTKDILISAEEMKKHYEATAKIISNHTKQPYDKVYKDMDRDYWMNAEEALEYGIIDEIVTNE